MTSLIARILLSIMMLPLAALMWVIIFIVLASFVLGGYEDNAAMGATAGTVLLVALYWLLLWRRSVVWSQRRIVLTIVGSLGCGLAGAFAGYMTLVVTGPHEVGLGVFFAGLFGIVLWLPVIVLIWKETAAERAQRIRRSAGDVIFCPRCGYNMTGLYEPRCPECGARFTVNELFAGQRRDEIGDAQQGE